MYFMLHHTNRQIMLDYPTVSDATFDYMVRWYLLDLSIVKDKLFPPLQLASS